MRRGRRQSDSSPLSMFSFQDIILTTIGVVLLIMLILALQVAFTVTPELLPEQHAVETTVVDPAEKQRQIEVRLELIEQLRMNPNDPTAAMEEAYRELASRIEASRTDLIQQRQQARLGNPDLQDEMLAINQQIKKAVEQAAELKEELREQLENSEQVSEMLDLMEQRTRLELQLEGMLANESLVYIRQEDPDHTPILVEFRTNEVIIHSSGDTGRIPEIWIDYPNPEERADAVAEIIRQLADERYYPLLLVQPGGGPCASLARESLTELSISSGFDLLEAEQTTVPDQLSTNGQMP